jgi:hypothetical protein
MTLSQKKLDEMTPRQLGHLIENAGDTLVRNEESTESMKALGDVAAETGHKIVALDGDRMDYNTE